MKETIPILSKIISSLFLINIDDKNTLCIVIELIFNSLSIKTIIINTAELCLLFLFAQIYNRLLKVIALIIIF